MSAIYCLTIKSGWYFSVVAPFFAPPSNSLLLIVLCLIYEKHFNKKHSGCIVEVLFKYKSGYSVSYKARVLLSLMAIFIQFFQQPDEAQQIVHTVLYSTITPHNSTVQQSFQFTILSTSIFQFSPFSSSCHSTKC